MLFNDKSSLSNIYNLKTHFVDSILKEPKLICLHTVKWFKILLCITNSSIKHLSFVYTQLNDQTLLFQTIQFSISQLFALSLYVKQFNLTYALDPIICSNSGQEWSWEQWQ